MCIFATALWAAEKPAPTSGTVIGILTAKCDAWIAVKAESDQEGIRYYAFWRGGAPNQGGGFDRQMIETIKKLPLANLVKVAWQVQEHRCIVSVEMIVPKEKAGTVVGTVVVKDDAWVDIKPEGGGPTERYTARWIGKGPKEGGGFDKEMIHVIAALAIGSKVRAKWTYDERKRVIQIERLAPPA